MWDRQSGISTRSYTRRRAPSFKRRGAAHALKPRSRFFPRPNVHVPLGSTTETRTLDGSFATLPSVPSIGTGCIVTAVVDMAGSRVEVADRPLSRPATAFRARPCTRHPNGELRSAATEKNFKMFKLSYETTTVRSDRPGERPIRGEVECSRSGVDRQHRQGRRAPRTQSTIAGAGIRARLHTFSCCMRGRMRHSAGPVPSPRLEAYRWACHRPPAKSVESSLLCRKKSRYKLLENAFPATVIRRSVWCLPAAL